MPDTLTTLLRRPARWLLVPALALLAACSPYKLVGDQVMKFGRTTIMPHELAGTDLGIGCGAATAFTAPGIAFERVGTDVDQMGVLLLLTAGVCTELQAQEQELAFLRAMRAEAPTEAQDARILQKRLHLRAAKRQYLAYQRFIKHYGEPREGHCPALRTEFDELVFMVGLLAGVQAMINDAQAGQLLGVPRDIAPNVGHMVACINSDRWWDVPLAVRAALWHVAPMLAPPDVAPLQIMEDVAHRGERDGVRLGHVIWALTTYTTGDHATARRALRDFAAAGERFTRNPDYRILDTIAEDVLLGLSDRIWTEATGHRTPMGALGTFPDDVPVATDIDDLL